MKNSAMPLFFKCSTFFFFLYFLQPGLKAQESGALVRTSPEIKNIEISANTLTVSVLPSDTEAVSYRLEVAGRKKLTVTENGKFLRFTELVPVSGILRIYVPEKLLLESLRIQTVNSNLTVEGIKAVYCIVSAIKSTVKIEKTRLKNTLIAVSADSKLTFNGGVVAVADFSVNASSAEIAIAEEEKDCNLSITLASEKGFTFKGEAYTEKSLFASPVKPKKFITLSSAFSNVAFDFVKPLTVPDEKTDKYGISEFGPKRPPQKDGGISNFVPKQNIE